MKNFTIEEAGNTFRFLSMNRRRIQLFQVYVDHEGKNYRFHMQIDENTGNFTFSSQSAYPANYHHCEGQFDYAIKNYGVAEIIPT